MAQEKQNAEDTIKKCVSFNGVNFVKAAKFRKNNIFKRKKTYTPRFDHSTCKKVLNPIGCTAAEKRGENFIFF